MMTLSPGEFIRRFLIHVLPKGLHRIRHYGLFASGAKAKSLERMRNLLGVAAPVASVVEQAGDEETLSPEDASQQPCPCCGGAMRIIEVFEAGCTPRHTVTPAYIVTTEGIDSS